MVAICALLIILTSVGYFPGNSSAADDEGFKKMMALMTGADITYERVGHYERPFKVLVEGGDWILEQQINYQRSTIRSAGDKKISVNDFPHNWVINGTWTFSQDGGRCKIEHADGGMVMRWECG